MYNDASSIIEQFLAAMRQQGIKTSDKIEADGKVRRCHVEGDRKGSKNGWYILHLDEHPAGAFGCAKRFGVAQKFSWSAKRQAKPLTPEERRAWREKLEAERKAKAEAERKRHEDAIKAAQAIWDAAKPAGDDHPYLQKKGVKAHGLRVGKWEKINHETGEVRTISDNALLVPIMDRQRKIHSLQAIFPSKLLGDRDKDYLKDGEKSGYFYALGTPQELSDGRRVFIVCEGYATGASLHECTGHMVLVTFDTSNLLPVAKALRERQPDAVIVFAADNDQWTTEPVANPGVHYATKAAAEVGGVVAWPTFDDLNGKPTDFNDLHCRQGAEAVARTIAEAFGLEPEQPQADDVPWDDAPAEPHGEPAEFEPDLPAPPPSIPVDDDEHATLERNGYFTVLGYDGGDYYLFVHAKRQVMTLRKGDIGEIGLVEYAPANWWEGCFPGGKNGGINKVAIAEWIFATAHARGIYDPSRVRGRGAWRDNGRFVFHYGSHLTVDGARTEIEDIQSGYVYPKAHALPEPADTPLNEYEGQWLLKVAEMVRWRMAGSAALMAGWVFLAPICGALKWRPHIWITGSAGTGKSTLQRDYCASLLGGVAIYAQGNSTEAGIRQKLRADARPVLLDEAESNDERERQRVEAILSLIRQSSSESQAETLKGTVSGASMHFHVRSMFCLASINTNLEKQADSDRLTKLSIRPPAKLNIDKELAHWRQLEEELHEITTDTTLPNRLLARALNMTPTVLETIGVFARVAAKIFKSQRRGDQYGTLLAGCWCLTRNHVASEEEAAAFVRSYDWTEHLEDNDQDDAQKAIEAILNAKIRLGGSLGELTIYELAREASTTHRLEVIAQDIADATLRRHGIRFEDANGVLLFGTSVPNLKNLLTHTPYSTDIRGQLLRLPGATKWDDKAVRFNGVVSKCVAIPVGLVLDGEKALDEPPI